MMWVRVLRETFVSWIKKLLMFNQYVQPNGCILELVNKPNITYRFTNSLKYIVLVWNFANIGIAGVWRQLHYWFKILSLNIKKIQADPINHQKVKKSLRNKFIE